jgi:hypothetical protein
LIFAFIMFLLPACSIQAQSTNLTTIYTSTWDPVQSAYRLQTNYVSPTQVQRTTTITNYAGATHSTGSYAPMYISTWNPATTHYDLVLCLVRVYLTTNITINLPYVTPSTNVNTNVVITTSYGAPVMTNFTLYTSQNISTAFDPSQHTRDTNGVPAITQSAIAGYGTVNNYTNRVVYTPAWGYVGTDTVQIVVTDRFGPTNTGTITIVVTNVPPQITGTPGSVTVYRHVFTPVSLPYYINPSGMPLYLTNLTSQALQGTNWSSSTNMGSRVYGSGVAFTTADTSVQQRIGYTVTDGFGSVTGVLGIVVLNHPVVVSNVLLTVQRDSTNAVPALNYCSDKDNDDLHVVSASATHGSASITATNLTFIPTPTYSGLAAIAYGVTDGYVTNTGTISVSVMSHDPVLTNYTVTLLKYSTVTSSVTTHAYSPYGTPLTVDSLRPTNCNGVATDTNLLIATAVPATLGVTLTDGAYHFGSGVVTIIPTNQIIFTDLSLSTAVNHSVVVPLRYAGYALSGDAVQVTQCSVPASGAILGGYSSTLTYYPATNSASTNTVSFILTTGDISATNTFTLKTTNTPPVVNNPTFGMFHDTNRVVTPTATSPTSLPLTFSVVGATNGTVTTNGGVWVYTPTPSFVGTGTIGVRVVDTLYATNYGLITVAVTNAPAPIAPSFTPSDILTGQAVGELWPAGVPVPVDSGAKFPKSASVPVWTVAQPSVIAPLTTAYSPVGLPLTLTGITATNCSTTLASNLISYTLSSGHTNAYIGYTVADGVLTASGLITIPIGRPYAVVYGYTNALHHSSAGTISIGGYNLASTGTLYIKTTVVGYGSLTERAAGSCAPLIQGQVCTWPGSGCTFYMTRLLTLVGTSTLMYGDSGVNSSTVVLDSDYNLLP